MIYTFRIGDSCNDGHGHYTDYYIESNMIKSEIEKIKPEDMEKIFGFSIYDICCRYEEYKITNKQLQSLMQHGFIPNNDFDKDLLIDEDMINIWIFMLQTVNPELKLKILKKPEIINTPYLVGYGVFYN